MNDNGREIEINDEEDKESVITPIQKGRYAKRRDHWNMIYNAASAYKGGPEYPSSDDEKRSGLYTDESLLSSDPNAESDIISDVSSEKLS